MQQIFKSEQQPARVLTSSLKNQAINTKVVKTLYMLVTATTTKDVFEYRKNFKFLNTKGNDENKAKTIVI